MRNQPWTRGLMAMLVPIVALAVTQIPSVWNNASPPDLIAGGVADATATITSYTTNDTTIHAPPEVTPTTQNVATINPLEMANFTHPGPIIAIDPVRAVQIMRAATVTIDEGLRQANDSEPFAVRSENDAAQNIDRTNLDVKTFAYPSASADVTWALASTTRLVHDAGVQTVPAHYAARAC